MTQSTRIEAEQRLLNHVEAFKKLPDSRRQAHRFLGYVFITTNEAPTVIPPIMNTVNFTMSFPSTIRRTCELLMLEEVEISFDVKNALNEQIGMAILFTGSITQKCGVKPVTGR